ncbi:MAG: class II aldolase/adducin family protein [Alphaproteobacteria bacterium]
MTDGMKRMHHVIGGGTFAPVRAHFGLSAHAKGGTAKQIHALLQARGELSQLHLTAQGDINSQLLTNDHVGALVDRLVMEDATHIIFFSPALVDFTGIISDVAPHKHAERLQSRAGESTMVLQPAEKVIRRIRAGHTGRKDVFLVGFKATAGATEAEQKFQAMRLLKESSCNLVLANDVVTRRNLIAVPEEAFYDYGTNRDEALTALVEMALSRSAGTFTRSTVVAGPRVDWNGAEVPASLRDVVNHCIARGAYKPFRGKTAGHFAARGGQEDEFLTSVRGDNFNFLAERGLIRVFAKGDDEVVAVGAKPSVGGQSQRIIFRRFPQLDCIVHFHCPTKAGSRVNVREQRPFECGSHECGANTANGLTDYGNGIFAVMLDNHGPNIVFNRNVDPQAVIAFIEDNFDLSAKTGGRLDVLEDAA